MSDGNEINRLALKLIRIISASITIFFCFLLIITYFILFLQVKFNILIKHDLGELENEERHSHSTFNEKAGIAAKEEDKKTSNRKIGLGSHYMLFLILSHFFGGIIEVISSSKNEEYEKDPKHIECRLFGFLHNFFDLSSVCWTTMLTYLFYKSTNLSSEILYKDHKYLFIGFLFWFLSCGIFCGIPNFQKAYGFSSTYCAFLKWETGKPISLILWPNIFIFVVFLNSIFNCFWLYKTTIFYSKKLKNLENKNKREYDLLSIFVKVFQIFPIVLIITRLIKFISVILLEVKLNKTMSNIFVYINGFCFNINGALNSIACIYFFRGVFWCCFPTKDNDDDNYNNIDKIDENNKFNLYDSMDSKENK